MKRERQLERMWWTTMARYVYTHTAGVCVVFTFAHAKTTTISLVE